MEKKKIVIVGNCQARPLAMAFERLSDEIEVTAVAIVHLLKSEQFAEYRQCFEDADYIVAQLVADNYPCNFVRTEFLNKLYGEKLFSILNLYFKAYSPDWEYLRIGGAGALFGPVSNYHNKVIFSCWKDGLTKGAAVSAYKNRKSFGFGGEVNESLFELKRREQSCNVCISDYIEERWKDKQLFHTFNHPCGDLLLEYAQRILNHIGVRLLRLSRDFDGWDPLSNYGLPSLPVSGKGFLYNVNMVGENREYFDEELVDAFYDYYDENAEKLQDFLGFDNVFYTSKIVEAIEEDIDFADRPCHPRVNEVKLRTPDVFVEARRGVLVNFGPVPEFLGSVSVSQGDNQKLGRVLDLSTPGGVVYTHWLFDLLPKFDVIARAGIDIDYFDSIVVNGCNLPFQKNTLGIFLPSGAEVLTLPELRDRSYYCEEHVYVTPVRKNLGTPRWVLDFINKKFPPMAVDHLSCNRVYLTRHSASRRKVVNEEEVSRFLKSKGFEIVECEKYSIPQISWIMSRAEVVIGPHGAGMANIAFCRQGVHVLELYSSHLSQEYWLFSKRNGLKYNALKCKNGKLQNVDVNLLDYKKNFFEINFDDIYVEIDSIEKCLKIAS